MYMRYPLLQSNHQEPSVCICFGFHFDGNRYCVVALTNSLCVAFTSHLITHTPLSPFLNCVVPALGIKLLDLF